ncbi:MAG: type II toxin-antitoxin system RelE/ParE family toxin [Myxococcales bacterium]|nr:type II toxin-antitoxin system RelE/ParE family toxin [Myxococcales bacterium]
MKFEVSKRARRQVEKIQGWWLQNRPGARGLFLDELAAAESDLRVTPDLGAIYSEHERGTVRRVLLPKTHHHLYYRYRPDRDELVVLSVWGAPRERGPKL